eukprot:445473_1
MRKTILFKYHKAKKKKNDPLRTWESIDLPLYTFTRMSEGVKYDGAPMNMNDNVKDTTRQMHPIPLKGSDTSGHISGASIAPSLYLRRKKKQSFSIRKMVMSFTSIGYGDINASTFISLTPFNYCVFAFTWVYVVYCLLLFVS